MMEAVVAKRWLDWTKTPITGVSLSVSGLFALADLSTVAKRTALTGTASWLDILVLAPGLHNQQAAEVLGTGGSGGVPMVTSLGTGNQRQITNTATIHWLNRIGHPNRPVTLDVASFSNKRSTRDAKQSRRRRSSLGPHGRTAQSGAPSTSTISVLLYLVGPALTIAAIILMILTRDWWGLFVLGALMLARAVNIFIIKSRTAIIPPLSNHANVHESWWVNLEDGRSICLRGLAHDLEAITTGQWMRPLTNMEGYVEAAAKLLTYAMAILSSNMFQSGQIILLVLLLCSAASLALSNAYVNLFNMNGRIAGVTGDASPPMQAQRQQPNQNQRLSNAPTVGSQSIGQLDGAGYYPDSPSKFEKDEASVVLHSAYPFDSDVNYV